MMGCCQICTSSSYSLLEPATFACLVQRNLSSAHLQVTENQVIAGTEAWIREWITKQKMCPYAQRSNYKIVPVCSDGDLFSSTFMTIFHEEVESLAARSQEDGQQMANTLLVLPNFEPFADVSLFEMVFGELCNPETQEPEMVCWEGRRLLEDSAAPVVMQIFHPDMDRSVLERRPDFIIGDVSALKYSLRSPWPVVQLLASKDLKAAREFDDKRILQRNAITLSKIGCEELEKRLESFRNISQ